MVFVYIISSVLAFIILCVTILILIPFTIVVDTKSNSYEFCLSFFFKAIYVSDESPYLQLKIFFFSSRIDISQKKNFPVSLFSEKKDKPKSRGFSSRMIKPASGALFRILKSFRVKTFEVSFDTGDFPLNARLVPVLYHISSSNLHFNVNFQEENYAIIELKNNLFNFIKYGLPLYFKIRKIRRRNRS